MKIEGNGLTIVSYESTWLSDLSAAYIFENMIMIFPKMQIILKFTEMM